jgi:hypothetical protein
MAYGIDYPVSCNSGMDVDIAEIFFEGPETYELYAVNSECYKCSNTLLSLGGYNFEGNYTSSCSQVFTPHEWKLKLMIDSVEVSSKSFVFGEHGKYIITISTSNDIIITEYKSPDNSNLPLYILIASVVVFCILVNMMIIFVKFYAKNKFSRAESSVNNYQEEDVGDSSNLETRLIQDESAISYYDLRNTVLPHNLMASLTTQEKKIPKEKTETAQKSSSSRLGSLDTFRGISLYFMVFNILS